VIDLIVAGGGPVGLGTAILAARAGLDVTVVEPRAAPVDKACGEGLMPAAVQALSELGAEPPGRPFHGIRYVDGRHRVEGLFRAGPGLGVRRTALHAALGEQAALAGVPILAGRVDGIRQSGAWVEAAGLRARYLAAADGLHSPVRQRLGLAVPAVDARARAAAARARRGAAGGRYGLRRHFRIAPWSDLVEVHWCADAEAYVTPVADDLVGLAVLFRGRGDFDGWLRRFPELAERLRGAPAATGVRGAGPLRQRARRLVAGRVLLVGDAAGYVDAITGEGISVGLRCAAELVRCVRADRPQEYARAWRRATRDYRLMTGALLWASGRPVLRRRLVPAAERLPWLFTAAVNQVA
jgi:flavin-dependent dehydrogenase